MSVLDYLLDAAIDVHVVGLKTFSKSIESVCDFVNRELLLGAISLGDHLD